MDNDEEFNGIRLQFALDGTAVALLCFCVVLMVFPCSPVGRAIIHNMQDGTGHCPGCRCGRVPAATAAPSSNDDEDEDKEDEGNDEEGGQKDKCD